MTNTFSTKIFFILKDMFKSCLKNQKLGTEKIKINKKRKKNTKKTSKHIKHIS